MKISKGERVDIASIKITNDQQQTNVYEFIKAGSAVAGAPFTVNGVALTLPPTGKFLCVANGDTPVTPLGTFSYTALHEIEKAVDLSGGVALDHSGNYWIAVIS